MNENYDLKQLVKRCAKTAKSTIYSEGCMSREYSSKRTGCRVPSTGNTCMLVTFHCTQVIGLSKHWKLLRVEKEVCSL